ncbi:sulfur carrier protein ThiS [Litorimonas sp. RW-G-Af-16]|uniref:sulfur carrier protein ThiS n=1 Tax=Litorimonas sp. RW-G-Af-16 TaxID=3241168 RepID=UPI00390CA210
MNLTINGEQKAGFETGLTIAQLIERLDLPRGKIAVELNRAVVPKSQHGTQRLAEGDILEIIHFIGGG